MKKFLGLVIVSVLASSAYAQEDTATADPSALETPPTGGDPAPVPSSAPAPTPAHKAHKKKAAKSHKSGKKHKKHAKAKKHHKKH